MSQGDHYLKKVDETVRFTPHKTSQFHLQTWLVAEVVSIQVQKALSCGYRQTTENVVLDSLYKLTVKNCGIKSDGKCRWGTNHENIFLNGVWFHSGTGTGFSTGIIMTNSPDKRTMPLI